MTKDLEVEQSAWEACPQGEFQRAQDKMALRERRKNLTQMSAVAVCAIVLVAVGVQARSIALNQRAESMAGGISCAEVQQFANGDKGANLDAETRAKIAAHLGGCRHCAAQTAVQFAKLNRQAAPSRTREGDIKLKTHCD